MQSPQRAESAGVLACSEQLNTQSVEQKGKNSSSVVTSKFGRPDDNSALNSRIQQEFNQFTQQ